MTATTLSPAERSTIAAAEWSAAKAAGDEPARRRALDAYRAARMADRQDRFARCQSCGRPVRSSCEPGPRAAACGCDYVSTCERHERRPFASWWCRGCARSTMRLALSRAYIPADLAR